MLSDREKNTDLHEELDLIENLRLRGRRVKHAVERECVLYRLAVSLRVREQRYLWWQCAAVSSHE